MRLKHILQAGRLLPFPGCQAEIILSRAALDHLRQAVNLFQARDQHPPALFSRFAQDVFPALPAFFFDGFIAHQRVAGYKRLDTGDAYLHGFLQDQFEFFPLGQRNAHCQLNGRFTLRLGTHHDLPYHVGFFDCLQSDTQRISLVIQYFHFHAFF